MAITLISNIKQANNGKFWLVDSNDIRGGLYHVDQKAEMQVLPVDNLKEGMLCYVAAEQRFYQYKKDAEGNLAFDVWKVGFDKSETFAELDNKTIINSIIANSGLIDKLQDQIDAITGTGEGGDATTIAGLNAQLASLKNTLGKATEGGVTGTGLIKRVEDVEAGLEAHTHEIADVNGLQPALDAKANKKDFDGLKALVGELPEGATADNVVGYVDEKVAALVGSAPDALDTLQELAAAIKNDANVVDTLNSAIGQKADKSALEQLAAEVETNKGASDAVDTRVSDLEALLAGFGGAEQPATVKDALTQLQETLATKVDQNAVNTTVAAALQGLALTGSEDADSLTISLDLGQGKDAVQLGKVDIPVVTATEVEQIIANLDSEK